MVILSGAYNNVTYYLNAALSSVITSCLIIYATIYRRYTIFMKAHVDASNM